MDAFEEMRRELRERHQAQVLAVLRANDDLAERSAALGVTTLYDEDDDVLRTLIGPPVEAATESVDHTVLLRYDPETLKLLGIEVLGFKALLGAQRSPDHGPLVGQLRRLAGNLDNHRRATKQVGERLAPNLKELAAV